ncbi:MAG: NAD-dependent epimerase/dehydratase family protein [Myxococcales bacterium]|nr:NAD-dependent epimerase/dehydratase family protein [Myxococcales bacterium]
MRVFVTGGSGFVGGHLIERLAPKHAVSALARSDKSAAVVEAFGATAVRGELGAVSEESLRGVDAIVHCAAFVEEWGTRAQFWEGNVEGTEQLLRAARAAGVRRFVHVGTEAALFDGHDLVAIDETAPYPAKQRFLYSESKAEAERRVLAANASDFHTVSIRPRLVWGPRDASVLPAVLRMAREGSWSWLDGGRHETSTTHVQNVCAALELALEHGRGGEAYFVVDDGTRTMRSFLSALAETQGVALPDRSAPSAVVRPLSALIEGTWRLVGAKRTPPMTRFAIAMMSSSITIDDRRARRELGYRPEISVDAGIAAMKAAHASARTTM